MEETEFLKIVNSRGEEFVLCPNYDEFGVLKIEGLEPPDVNVSIVESATVDGGVHSNSHIYVRNIVISVVLFGENEEERRKLYRMLPLKSVITLYYRNSQYYVKTNGHVKHIDPVHYRERELARIEIVCPDPYLHAVEPITVSTAGNPPACTIKNDADCEVGFTARVVVYTDHHPAVSLGTSDDYTLTNVYDYKQNLFLRPQIVAQYDPTYYKLCELCVNGLTDISNSITSASKILQKYNLLDEGYPYIHVVLDSDKVPSRDAAVTYTIVTDTNGGSVDNLQYLFEVTSRITTFGVGKTDVEFSTNIVDTSVDYCDLYLRKQSDTAWEKQSANDYTINPSGISGTHTVVRFDSNIIDQGYIEAKIIVFHDSTGADVRESLNVNGYSEPQRDGTEWYFHCYNSFPSSYSNTRDVPYIEGERVENDALSPTDVYIVPSGGSVESYTILSAYNLSALTFSYVYSIAGDTIVDFTDEQIEAGLAGQIYVHGLKLKSETTGAEMPFTNTRFQLGDVIEISTVPKALKATIVERDGQAADISLLYDVARNNGDFVKLVLGDNSLKFTATDNVSLVSADFSVERLFGGV